MDALNYETLKSLPLRSGEQIVDRVAELIGSAVRTNLWFILLDADRIQLSQLIELDREGVTDDELVHGVSVLIGGLASIEDVSAVVAVLERPGSEEFTDEDRAWARALSSASRGEELELAGVLVSHSSGVRWLADDDYLAG